MGFWNVHHIALHADADPPLKLFTFDQFSAWLSPTVSANPTSLASLGGSHGKLRPVDAELQSGGRQRSPELIAEDERLMDGLQKRNLAGKPPQTVQLPLGDSQQQM
jgi:hypothetical protein